MTDSLLRSYQSYSSSTAVPFPVGAATSAVALNTLIDNIYGAYSPHRVVSTFATATMRVRRSSDDTEQDFTPNASGWVTSADVLAFIGGGTGHVYAFYDQTGNARHGTQATAGLQPTVVTTGSYVSIRWTKSASQSISLTSVLADFARAVGAVSHIAVRKHVTTATADASDHCVVWISNGTAVGSGRARTVFANAGTLLQAGGRILDANGNVNTTGLAGNTNWGVQIARFDATNADLFHDIDGTSESNLTWQSASAGNFSNTASLNVNIGSNGETQQYMNAECTLVAFVQDKITDAETATLMTSLSAMKAENFP